MVKKNPRVSLGVPVYNGEAFLAESLDSLLSQTYGDFELIISDNASTDRTESICRSYATADPRIRYQRQEDNRGAVWNFNHVFKLSRGEYFKWAAHDDLHAPTFLARCVDVLDRHPDVAWCHPQSTHIDSVGKLLPDSASRDVSYAAPATIGSKSRPTRESPHPHERFRAILLGTGGTLDVYGLIRWEVVARTMLQLPYYGAEKILVAELGLRGRFQEIPETLFFMRVHEKASGSLRTAALQRQFIDPKSSRWFGCTRLQLLRGYARAVLRSGLTVTQQSRCFAVLLGYLWQVGKWKSIVAATCRGRGTGGGYLDQLPAGDHTGPALQSDPSTPHQQQDNHRPITQTAN